MEPNFSPQHWEEKLSAFWEQNRYLRGKVGKPYTILMPPPNANASLHAGHGMYMIDDVMIRFKRLRGYASLWIPGTDHAGFETQYVYEKHLAKQGKSRLDFDRETLYRDIFAFVKENSGRIYGQFRRLGFLADWERSVFTLDAPVLKQVYDTFAKMESEGYVYRSDYILNYCTHCGTSLSELEVDHRERRDPLYYIRYGPFVLATVRPETKFGDTALAVHPRDKRYKKWVGKTIEAQGLLGKFTINVIADLHVDPKFGTGAVQVTPAHDAADFDMGRRHNLEIKKVIDLTGRLTHVAGPYAGMKGKVARAKVAEDLKKNGLIEKIDENYLHAVTICYKCKRDLEPMIIPNWFIRVGELKKPVITAISQDKVKFYPTSFKRQILQWLKNMHDWPISRQIAWGIRIPVWYDVSKNPTLFVVFLDRQKTQIQGEIGALCAKYSFAEIEAGLQKLIAPTNVSYIISQNKPAGKFLQETDTFDTWFSSGQWPLVTLKKDEYAARFPTDMMGTLSDILPFWVSRMIMFSLYLRQEVPFKDVYLWSMVADRKGAKMSKSKGNVIDPLKLVDQYGADAFRASLIFGIGEGGKVILAEDKVRAMRNFANKIWNIGRFIWMSKQNKKLKIKSKKSHTKTLKQLKKEFDKVKAEYLTSMEKYQFSRAFDLLYEFLWHRFADLYIDELKQVYLNTLLLLHPFVPFVTEAVWKVMHGEERSILEARIKIW